MSIRERDLLFGDPRLKKSTDYDHDPILDGPLPIEGEIIPLRQSVYTDALGAEICERIAGGESLVKICESPHMPSYSLILRWAMNPEHVLHRPYREARICQAEGKMDEIYDIADGCNGEVASEVAKAKLRSDNRKWVASRLMPKAYGDRITADIEDTTGHNVAASMQQLATVLDKAFTRKLEEINDDEEDDLV